MKKLYTAVATATGGREGKVRTDDGNLEVTLVLPKALGGPGGQGTNPEQLFAAGYSACFESALRHVARQQKITITKASVTASVDIGSLPAGGFQLAAKLSVSLPDLERDIAEGLIEKAHQVCPYSNATRGNMEVDLELAQ